MIVRIEPGRAKGVICAPPSKSMAHRLLIAGAFSPGSTIKNVACSQDILATLDVLAALGAVIVRRGNDIDIGGLDPFRAAPTAPLCCRESGSTLRFLLPVALLCGRPVTFTGSDRLFARSLSVYETLCRERGFLFEAAPDRVTVCGRLTAGEYALRSDISSQFLSGMMFALSRVSGDSVLHLLGKPESTSYLDLTSQALAAFGISAGRTAADTVVIRGGEAVTGRQVTVEGDCSNAAFFDAYNLLGGEVTVDGLSPDTRQGDRVYREMFARLRRGAPTLDISDCPDLGPVLMALAAAGHGATLTGTHRLKIKESDRGAAMAEELTKMGACVTVEENCIRIFPAPLHAPAVPLCGHNDHRLVMALALPATVVGAEIEGAEAVSKSLPDFFDRLASLQIKVKYEAE